MSENSNEVFDLLDMSSEMVDKVIQQSIPSFASILPSEYDITNLDDPNYGPTHIYIKIINRLDWATFFNWLRTSKLVADIALAALQRLAKDRDIYLLLDLRKITSPVLKRVYKLPLEERHTPNGFLEQFKVLRLEVPIELVDEQDSARNTLMVYSIVLNIRSSETERRIVSESWTTVASMRDESVAAATELENVKKDHIEKMIKECIDALENPSPLPYFSLSRLNQCIHDITYHFNQAHSLSENAIQSTTGWSMVEIYDAAQHWLALDGS